MLKCVKNMNTVLLQTENWNTAHRTNEFSNLQYVGKYDNGSVTTVVSLAVIEKKGC